MENTQESMVGLLHCLDEAIGSRDRRYKTLDAQYKNPEGHILNKEYDEYSRRKDSIKRRFKDESIDFQVKINKLCQRIRKNQPSLMELSSKYINTKSRFPRNIALGKLHVVYNNLDFFVPKTFSFPFEKPMYICDESKNVILHKVILRLLFALPIDKQEYYVFDPIGLGKTISKFNSLLSNENLFPQKKVLSTTLELKNVLKELLHYILDLQTNIFNIATDCQDWDSYNRRVYSQKDFRKILPYKILIFTTVPDGMDQECFDMFRTLIIHGKQCGLLVLFSFNESILSLEDTKMKKIELELKQCIENSMQLHNVFENDDINNKFNFLSIENIGERFPDDHMLNILLNDLSNIADKQKDKCISFEEIMEQGKLFDCNSCEGLNIPIGSGASGSSIIHIEIGDATPHYLIGGTTGSGKSNFLHNLIMSACCRYSPNEMNVYLLDFKEGVEFSQYVNPNLRHAKLVATEADTEYGITVLEHLVKEKEKRYDLFKASGCKDIQGYRQKMSNKSMPRIMVVIDEFQVLFGSEYKEQTIKILEILAKQGRACGIHLILATQSLKGIDFSTLNPQFGGRIALKCSSEDSKYLLGGITSNNEEAAELKVPFAILNTSQGSISENKKFMIPYAEEKKITEWIKKIEKECDSSNIETETKVFDGQSLPHRPIQNISLKRNYFFITFGEQMDYDCSVFSVKFKPRINNNLLICGHDDMTKKSLLNSVIYSSMSNGNCEEIIYVGDNSELIDTSLIHNVICYFSMKEIYEKYSECPYDKKRILIIDNCDLTRQIEYSATMFGTPKAEAAFFKEYLNNANQNGSYIIAFYDGVNRIKACGIPKEFFNYRIGYSINVDEKNSLLESGSLTNTPVKKNRAFFADNSEIKAWFKPYSI